MSNGFPAFKALVGHTSPETAYVVDDYPYGFRLRCKIRYWIEYRPKHGYRFVSQTSNPKRGGSWNQPKRGIYHDVIVMHLDGEGHVTYAVIGASDDDARINAVRLLVGDEALAPFQSLIKVMRIARDKIANAWRARLGEPLLPFPPPPLPTWAALVAAQQTPQQTQPQQSQTADAQE